MSKDDVNRDFSTWIVEEVIGIFNHAQHREGDIPSVRWLTLTLTQSAKAQCLSAG